MDVSAVVAGFAQMDVVVARVLGAQWLVYGPAEAQLNGPAAPPAFQSGVVRVYRVS